MPTSIWAWIGAVRVSRPRGLELRGEQVLDLGGDLAEHAREGARRLPRRGVPHEDPEAVGVGLDVAEQRERRLLEQDPGALALAERERDAAQQRLDLAVDDDGVEALLAAEVLVDDGLGDLGPGCDLLDARRLEALVGEQLPADRDELLAALGAGHPRPGSGARGASRGALRGRGSRPHCADRLCTTLWWSRSRDDPRLVCRQGPPDFESGPAT